MFNRTFARLFFFIFILKRAAADAEEDSLDTTVSADVKTSSEDIIHNSDEASSAKKEKKVEFYYEGGIKEFVTYLNKSKEGIYENIMYFEGTKNEVYVEVAMQHNDSYNESIFSFVNNINTPEGGTHLVGFRNALTKTFNDYARKNKLLKDSEPPRPSI